jgi:hypothetical protein
MNPRRRALLLTTGLALFLLNAILGRPVVADATAPVSERTTLDPAEPGRQSTAGPANAELEPYRAELLQIAFDVATAIPIRPHIKTRSRTQQAVVEACLELDQPETALDYLQGIGNWRRGASYAELALYCARHGHADEARAYLDRAYEVAWTSGLAKWRRDRIRVKIAMTYAVLGEQDTAAVFERDLEASERGKVAALNATKANADSFDQRLQELDAMIATADFDLVRNALYVAAELFDRFYDDDKRRSLAEQKIKSSWGPLPIMIRIELLMKLAEIALEHGDRSRALSIVDEGQAILDEEAWTPRFEIPLRAQLAALRFRAGDAEQAREQADAALALFEAERSLIINIYRAEALRPLAEAYHAMGDIAATRSVHGMVVEEGMVNPNSRPRAEDLSATCRSLALNGVEPDEALWIRIREIKEGLGQPW